MVPVPDRDRFVQDRRDPGLLALPAQPRVVGWVGPGAGHHRSGADNHPVPFGRFGGADTSRAASDAHGLTATGREQP